MPKVFVYGELKATWRGGHIGEELETAQQVARTGVRLLVEEMGTQAARRFLRRELARYKADYNGDGQADPEGPLKG